MLGIRFIFGERSSYHLTVNRLKANKYVTAKKIEWLHIWLVNQWNINIFKQ